jgi:hypothetical protein
VARRARQSLKAGPERFLVPACALVAALVLASCATLPRGTVAERDEFAALGGGAVLYLRVDTQRARPVLEAIAKQLPSDMGAKRVSQLLDRTESAAFALFAAGSPRRYLIATRGRFPTGTGAFSLALNSEWRKQTAASGKKYWRSTSGVSLAFSRDSALISDGEPFGTLVPLDRPAAYSSYIDGALLSGWIPEPAVLISSLLGEAGSQIRLPVDSLVFVLVRAEEPDHFVLESRLAAPSPERARSLSIILNLARSSLKGNSSSTAVLMAQLFSEQPALDGKTLILRSTPMTSEEIALLCASISIHL